MESFKLFLFFLTFFLLPSSIFALKTSEGDLTVLEKYSTIPDLYIGQSYSAKIVILNNGTETLNIVKEEASLNGTGISLYPETMNPSTLEPGEKGEFYLKADLVDLKEGEVRKLSYNLTTEENKTQIWKKLSVKDPLGLKTWIDLRGEKITKFGQPFSFKVRVLNNGTGGMNYRFNTSFPKGIVQVKAKTAKGEFYSEELEKKKFFLSSGSKSVAGFKILPIKAGKAGTLKITVFDPEYPAANDSISLDFHTLTRLGKVFSFYTGAGLKLYLLFLAPFLALILLKKRKGFNFLLI